MFRGELPYKIKKCRFSQDDKMGHKFEVEVDSKLLRPTVLMRR